MRGRCKKLVSDISRGVETEKNIREYAKLLSGQYNFYSTVKVCMNYYTMKEIVFESEDKNTDVCRYFKLVSDMLERYIIDRNAVDDEVLEKIRQLRDNVEFKMKNLTAYTDGYEIYEYILNRVEAGIKDELEAVDIDELSEHMFRYVFSENDTVVVNSKLQLLMSQLPVRMTKNKFYDVVSNTLSIYKGGETNSVDDFADMLRTAVLIKKPKGFETEYPYLYHVYCDLAQADYKKLDLESFNKLDEELAQAAAIINNEVSAYVLLQEIINDVYAMLLTVDSSYDDNMAAGGYKAAVGILSECMKLDDMEELPESLMTQFMSIEGVQETCYENIMILEAVFDDIKNGRADVIKNAGLEQEYDRMSIVEKLLSTSLFVDLDKNIEVPGVVADNDYIMKLREELTAEFAELFAGNDRMVNRSIMCKILSSMPIFLNSREEIKNYFDYVLGNCKDDSELTACSRLIRELIEEE